MNEVEAGRQVRIEGAVRKRPGACIRASSAIDHMPAIWPGLGAWAVGTK